MAGGRKVAGVQGYSKGTCARELYLHNVLGFVHKGNAGDLIGFCLELNGFSGEQHLVEDVAIRMLDVFTGDIARTVEDQKVRTVLLR